MVETQERLTIKQLLQRYDLREKKTIYRWKKVAGIEEFSKDDRGMVLATPEEVAKLDLVAEHMKKPRANLNDFVPPSKTEIVTSISGNNGIEKAHEAIENNLDLSEIVDAIAEVKEALLLFQRGNLEAYNWLELASDREWLLSSSQVKDLIGIKPSVKKGENSFIRGNWEFIKSGKIGRETAWLVQKRLHKITHSS